MLMNYDKTNKLEIDEKTTITVKSKSDCIYNISVVVNNIDINSNDEHVKTLIKQCNEETVNGFFYIDERGLTFRLLIKEKCNQTMLHKNINNAIASISSFIQMLEVITNE